MSLLTSEGLGENEDRVERVNAVGASVFGHPMWPQAYNEFVHAVDCAMWVHDRLAEVNYNQVGVPEGGPASIFVRDVLVGSEDLWWS